MGWLKTLMGFGSPGQRVHDWPIELEDNGFAGRVRRGGTSGEQFPDLIAHRPEPGRFTRLDRIVERSREIAEQDLGNSAGERLVMAMQSIADFKGDFTVTWRPSLYREEFERIVDTAIQAEGESEILHRVSDDPA